MYDQIFTVNEYAKLHEVGKRTLHYYDEIGLFTPAIKKDNGYRYYTSSQSSMLEMILTLKELNMSLDEIKSYMSSRKPEDFKQLLQEKQKAIDDEIEKLKEIKQMLRNKEDLLEVLEEDLNQIVVLPCDSKYYITTEIDHKDNYVKKMMKHGTSLPNHFFNHEIGTMIDSSKLNLGNYNDTDYICSRVEKKHPYTHVRVAGNYIRAFQLGDFSDMSPTYKKILAYCNTHGLSLTGYSYETGVNDMSVLKIEDYVTMVEVRCVKE